MNIKLSKAQEIFLTATTRGRIFLGGIGSGKSRALCYCAVLEALKNRQTAIISFSYRNLSDVIATTLAECCNDLAIRHRINKAEMIFYANGNPILLRSSDSPDKLRGLNLHSFLCDEAREMTEETFNIMLGRIRNSEDSFWALSSTTRGKNWFYYMIKNNDLLSVFDTHYAKNENITVVLQPTLNSPFLPEAYIKELSRTYTTSLASQELRGMIIEGEGEIIKPDWFKIQSLSKPISGARLWDLAVTTNTSSDYSAGCLMSTNMGKFYINDMKRVKLAYPDLKKLIIDTALDDGPGIHIGIEVSGQQRAILDDLRRDRLLNNYVLKPYRPTKDKITRAYPVASQAELGNMILNDGPWVRKFLDECSTFSAEGVAKGNIKDDQVDALTGAYHLLTNKATVCLANLPI
jgi:predicted phage terminase large subunit-like protein